MIEAGGVRRAADGGFAARASIRYKAREPNPGRARPPNV